MLPCSVSPQTQTSVAEGPHEVEGRQPSLQPHDGAWFATYCGFGSQDADTDSRGEQLWPGFRGQGQERRGWLGRPGTFTLSLLRCQARCRLSLESSCERKTIFIGRVLLLVDAVSGTSLTGVLALHKTTSSSCPRVRPPWPSCQWGGLQPSTPPLYSCYDRWLCH